MSGWGLKYFDYDNDGLIDLLLANGHPDDMIDSYSMQVNYKEPLLLFHQGADHKLHDVSAGRGSGVSERIGRREDWPWAITTMTARWMRSLASTAGLPCS